MLAAVVFDDSDC